MGFLDKHPDLDMDGSPGSSYGSGPNALFFLPIKKKDQLCFVLWRVGLRPCNDALHSAPSVLKGVDECRAERN